MKLQIVLIDDNGAYSHVVEVPVGGPVDASREAIEIFLSGVAEQTAESLEDHLPAFEGKGKEAQE